MFERMPWDEYRDTGEPDEREQLACKDDGAEACGCEESLALRAELATVRAERDYLLAFHDATEIRQMRADLREQWARQQGHLPEAEQSDFTEVLG